MGASSQMDEVLLLSKVKTVFILPYELIDLVGVHVITINRFAIFVTGYVLHVIIIRIIAVAGRGGLAQDACPLPVQELTALGFTDAGVAEVRTLESMTLSALCTFLAITVNTKGSTYRGTWRHLDVSIPAARVGAVILDEMQTGWSPFSTHIVREIALVPVHTFAFLQEILASSDLRRVVHIPASGAFRTGTYTKTSVVSGCPHTYRVAVAATAL